MAMKIADPLRLSSAWFDFFPISKSNFFWSRREREREKGGDGHGGNPSAGPGGGPRGAPRRGGHPKVRAAGLRPSPPMNRPAGSIHFPST
jgi:hypothetical protein